MSCFGKFGGLERTWAEKRRGYKVLSRRGKELHIMVLKYSKETADRFNNLV